MKMYHLIYYQSKYLISITSINYEKMTHFLWWHPIQIACSVQKLRFNVFNHILKCQVLITNTSTTFLRPFICGLRWQKLIFESLWTANRMQFCNMHHVSSLRLKHSANSMMQINVAIIYHTEDTQYSKQTSGFVIKMKKHDLFHNNQDNWISNFYHRIATSYGMFWYW